MRKVEIVNRIAEETGLTKVKAEEAVDAILEEGQRGPAAGSRSFYDVLVRFRCVKSGHALAGTRKLVRKPVSRPVVSSVLSLGSIFKAAVDGESA